jgi:hypothetical protein
MSKKNKYSSFNKVSEDYNQLRRLTKKIMRTKTIASKDEQLFEDDPKAVEEKENGKILKQGTHVFSKNIIDDL